MFKYGYVGLITSHMSCRQVRCCDVKKTYLYIPVKNKKMTSFPHFNASVFFQVKKLTKCLDPNAHGRINFKDFCHGVFAIKGNLLPTTTLKKVDGNAQKVRLFIVAYYSPCT